LGVIGTCWGKGGWDVQSAARRGAKGSDPTQLQPSSATVACSRCCTVCCRVAASSSVPSSTRGWTAQGACPRASCSQGRSTVEPAARPHIGATVAATQTGVAVVAVVLLQPSGCTSSCRALLLLLRGCERCAERPGQQAPPAKRPCSIRCGGVGSRPSCHRVLQTAKQPGCGCIGVQAAKRSRRRGIGRVQHATQSPNGLQQLGRVQAPASSSSRVQG
jgi:hypothetical protein